LAKRLTIEEVISRFESAGCRLLSETYSGKKQPLDFICFCGNAATKTLDGFRKTSACQECGEKSARASKRLSIETVREKFRIHGCVLISSEYKNNSQSLDFLCKCGHRDSKVLDKFLRTGACRKCGEKSCREKRRVPYEKVKQIFKEQGCELLSKEYYRNNEKLEFRCSCGGLGRETLSDFTQKGLRCDDCKKIKRYTFEEVKSFFENKGCELLETSYSSIDTPMSYRCECGNDKNKISFYSFKSGQRCRVCRSRKLGDRGRKYTHSQVRSIFEKEGCVLLEKTYRNSHTPMRYICSCGSPSKIRLDKFEKGQRCKACGIEKMMGENNPSYNPDLSEEERIATRHYEDYYRWRKQVYEKDSYTCQCCGVTGGSLSAHHLDGYNWCKERRTDISNGMTLCRECHTDFHVKYKYGNNTEAQYTEWLRNKRKQDAN
jgi:hypothetical protein